MLDDGDAWRLLERFPRMSSIGRAIMGKKLDRALATRLAGILPGGPSATMLEKVVECTRDINRLACIAAKNW